MGYDKDIILREEYISRINRVQDYIEINLAEKFSLIKLSQIANFSPYHFHRIFCVMTGETLFQYIQRVRLEKAAFLLLVNQKTSITRIALECGFSNQASFAKAFKKYFSVSASQLRTASVIPKGKDCKAESNIGKVFTEIMNYNGNIRNRQRCAEQTRTGIPFTVDIKEIPDMSVVYIRHTGPYKKDAALFQKLFKKLFNWANARGLIHTSGTKWLTLCHDNPDLTDDDKLRISVCMTTSGNIQTDGEIGNLTIPGGKYAVGHYRLNEDQYQDAWYALFAEWFPESGYQPDDRLSFELYLNDATDDPKENHMVDLCVPVRAL